MHGIQAQSICTADFLKQKLDTPLLQLSGLMTPAMATAWTRTEPRIKTALLYKQQKFNLLREESEGYSKLQVELLSSMGAPHDARTARPAEPMESVTRRAETANRNVKALIGYFDLDPARTLDIILDTFADNILYYHVFFREFLRLSPWGPDEQGDANRSGASSNGDDQHGKKPLLPDGSFESRPEGASSICAHILGFKFAWYAVGNGELLVRYGSRKEETADYAIPSRLARVLQKRRRRSCTCSPRYSSGMVW